MNKILVIDNNIYNIKIVQMAMASIGCEVIDAYNGNEGIIRAKDELPDLIFMDISMPTMDGIEAMNQLKELPALKNVPIIAYTAYAMRGDRERFLDEGFDDYLSKPVCISDLIATTQKHLRLRI